LLRESGRYVIADRLGASGVSLRDELAYLRPLGIRSAVVEMTGANDVETTRDSTSVGSTAGEADSPRATRGLA
jgi:hypothetical protein